MTFGDLHTAHAILSILGRERIEVYGFTEDSVSWERRNSLSTKLKVPNTLSLPYVAGCD